MPFKPDAPETGSTFKPDTAVATPASGSTFKPLAALTVPSGEAPAGYERTENGLQPSGLITPPEPDPDSLTEDVRRAGEWTSKLPQRAATTAMNTVERMTDLPITRMYARTMMDANKVSAPTLPLPTMDEKMAEKGGPNYAKDTTLNDSWNWLSAFDTEGTRTGSDETPELKPLDVPLPGTSVRQVVNAASHNIIGRPVKAFQEGPGTTLSQVALEGARPFITGQKRPESGGAEGGVPNYIEDVTPAQQIWDQNQGGLGPEGKELLAREFLSFYAGEHFQLGFDDKRYRTAVEQLEKEYGTGVDVMGIKGLGGAAHVQAMVHEVAGLPVYLWTSGLGEEAAVADVNKAAQAIKATPKLAPGAVGAFPKATAALKAASTKAGAVEGVVQSYLTSAARDGEDVFTAAGYGGFLGGTLGYLAGAATAKGIANKMSKDFHAGVMLSRAQTTDFLKELDDLVSNVKAKQGPMEAVEPLKAGVNYSPQQLAKRRDAINRNTAREQAISEAQAKHGSARPGFEEVVAGGQRNADFDVKVVSGEPVKPTGSYVAVNDKGETVMRDFEVRAVRKTKRTTASPSTDVSVTQKGQTGAGRTVNPKATSVGEGLEVRVKVRDTPIKDGERMLDMMNQDGRRMVPAMQNVDADQAVQHMQGKYKDGQVGGTPQYMSPQHGKEYGGDLLNRRLEKMDDLEAMAKAPGGIGGADTVPGRGASPVAGMSPPVRMADGIPSALPKAKALAQEADGLWGEFHKKMNAIAHKYGGEPTSPVMMGVDPDGTVSMTVIKARPPPEPRTWQMKGGDTVLIDGQAEGTVIGVPPPGFENNVTVALKNGGQATVAKASLTHIPREFYKPVHEGQPIVSAKPGTLVDDRTEAIVKGIEGGTTVPDMMRIAGRPDPAWAAAALRNMEERGLLYEREPGLFEPTSYNRKRPKGATPEGQSGYAVFIGTGGANGRGDIGILRGKDPRNAKNWLVEVPVMNAGEVDHPVAGKAFAKTKTLSVGEDELRNMRPVGLASKTEVDPLIDMYGWTKPMPPQFYQMSKATTADQELMTKAWSKVNTQPGWFGRNLQALQEAFAGTMHVANPELRKSKAQYLFGIAGMMRSEGLSRANMLAKNLELGSQASHDFTKVLEATRARSPSGQTALNPKMVADWVAKYPAEAKAALNDFTKMSGEADDYSRFLASRGVANIDDLETARAHGLESEYLTRTYQAFLMPREDWAKYARTNLTEAWKDSIDWLYKNRPNHNNDFSTTAAELDEILRLDNPIQALQEKGYIKAEGSKKLKERQDVPEPFRRLLGEHRDAAIRMGFGVSYQRQLVKAIQGWDAVSAHPNLWSPGWRPDMTLKVPDLPTFGSARNGFMPDNATSRSLLGDRNPASMSDPHALLRAVGWLGQRWKAAHTVYNQVSWFNNVVRNFKGVLLSGGFTGNEDMQGFRDAARMLMDYHNDPTVYGPNKLLVEAMDFDAVGPGLAGAELGLEQKKFTRKMLQTFDKQRKGPNPLLDAFAEAREAALSVPEKVHNGYDFADKLAKFGSYLNLRRNFIAQGMSVSDAAAMASLRVNQSFQNFQRTHPSVKAVAGNFALAAPFLSSKLEDVRINATAATRLLKGDEPDLILRMMAMGAIVGGTTFLANNARRANGISDEQNEKDMASLPLRSKERHPFLIGSLDYDKHKRRTFTDLTPYEDLLTSFRGSGLDPLALRIIFNNAEDILGPDSLVGDAARGLSEWSGALHPQQGDRSPRPDQTGLLGAVGKYGPGFLPQGPVNAIRNADRVHPSGRLIEPEAFTPDQALTQTLTGTIDAITGPQTDKQWQWEKKGAVVRGVKDIGAAAMDAAVSDASPERKKYMIKSNVRELKQQLNQYRKLKE